MKCEACGLDMVIYQMDQKEDGKQEAVYVCRNPRCVRFDRRLKKEPADQAGG